MAELLASDGRLVCLEFPSGKPLSTSGPPWGVVPEVYTALLSRPGDNIEYDSNGGVVERPEIRVHALALRRLSLLRPTRTHPAGIDQNGHITDFISVWGR
jgi:methyl halide transferase